MDTGTEYSPEQLREMAKVCLFHSIGDKEKRSEGIRLLLKAYNKKDPEATYYVGKLILDGVLRASAEDQQAHALSLIQTAANKGCIQARAFLNAYCERQYRNDRRIPESSQSEGALTDFEGKPIKIDRRGVLTPIDAVLEYRDGTNVLTLSANLMFIYGDDIPDRKRFEQAVRRGIMAWEGEYQVFGGQRLSVRVRLTEEDKIFDNLFIMPVTDDIGAMTQKIGNVIGTKEKKAQIADIMTNKRSFAYGGLKWSVNSRKLIYILSENGLFNDYEEIMHVTKHEFGHALGLGDLYKSEVDSLAGVTKGTYYELDSYAIGETMYNLVMCDHHGPISNNDIEMVILAYRESKMQMFQTDKTKGKISSALGKGN